MTGSPSSKSSTKQDEAPILDANLISDLPSEIFSTLIRCTPQRQLWQWLTKDSRIKLLHNATRGFQCAPASLRQTMVRARLAQHLQQQADDFNQILHLWSSQKPLPTAVAEVRSYGPDDAQLIAALPRLWRDHGLEALVLALLAEGRSQALLALETVTEAAADEPPTSTSQEPNEEATSAPQAPNVTTLQEEIEKLRAQSRSLQERAESADRKLTVAREERRTEAQAQRREFEQQKKNLVAAENSLAETKRLLDRTERRQRRQERDLQEQLAENKRLQRQVRQQQQLNEELRKQISTLQARLEPAPKAATVKEETKPSSKPLKPAKLVIDPLLQPFVWKSDGRPFKVSPRDIKRAIDRNDEEFVFRLIQALDALREMNKDGYKMLLERVRQLDRYYARVLTADTTRVLVDASNVARHESDRYGRGILKNLLLVRDELKRRDCFPIVIYADASLPHNIDEPSTLLQMVKAEEVILTVAGQEADELLARQARRTGAYVVTNDRNFHLKVAPDFEPPRIGFKLLKGILMLDDF